MKFSQEMVLNHILKTLPFIFLQIITFNFIATIALLPTYILHQCINSTGNYSLNSFYERDVTTVLADLTTSSATTDFSNSTSGADLDKVFGLYYCRGDVDRQLCNNCVQSAAQKLKQSCPLIKEAIIYYQECTLRYANRNIFSLEDESFGAYWYSFSSVSNSAELEKQISSTVPSLIRNAAYNDSYRGFATGEANLSLSITLYCLVQCTPDILGRSCERCLTVALGDLQSPCCNGGKRKLLVFNPSCQFMYDTAPFYTVSPPPLPSPSPSSEDRGAVYYLIRAGIPAVCVILLLLCAVAFYFCRPKNKNQISGVQNAQSVKPTSATNSLEFSLETIRSATSDFSDTNKLGEGGFGAVYRGRLPDGRDVAVKRLSTDSAQGDREFANEVQLLAMLKHRNLVRLLGFSVEDQEKLLVYEFMPNMSLDKFLFDPNKRKYLDWETRFKIIIGIARGVLYLHEDSRLKIIHRDLKASNVLLDQEMNPKLADFGMARLVKLDQTQANTMRIVGTFGYMAPEYAMSGLISTKADVYSFGVVLLEIISGRSNNFLNPLPGSESLLSKAWRLWNTGSSMELVDPLLGDNYSSEEVLRCVQVALFCAQEDAASRPTLASVLLMLNSNSSDFPPLRRPTPQSSSTLHAPGLRTPESGHGHGNVGHHNEYSNESHSTANLEITDLYPR